MNEFSLFEVIAANERSRQRIAMPFTPEEVEEIRGNPKHPNHYDLGPYHDLPHPTPEEKQDREPQFLHRGIRVRGIDNNGLNNGLGGTTVTPELIRKILESGIGQHFTNDIQNAAAFGDPANHDEDSDYPGAKKYPGPKDVGMVFTIKHPGSQHVGINPDGDHVNDKYWDDEHEITLNPGVPIEVSSIYVRLPGSPWTQKWKEYPVPNFRSKFFRT